MELKDYIGKHTGAGTIHLERGSLSRFAHEVTENNPVYHDLNAAKGSGFSSTPVPPTCWQRN